MKFKRIFPLFFAMLMLLIFAGCMGGKDKVSSSAPESSEPESDPNWPVTVGDITLEKKPEKVVSLSPALTELIFEIGEEKSLRGVSDYCDYPEKALSLDKCGTAQIPNFEEIEKIAPTLVVSSSALTQNDTVRLQQLGAQVKILPTAGSMEELDKTYTELAILLGGAEVGRQNGSATFASLTARLEAMKAAANTVSDDMKVTGIYLRLPPLVMATGDTIESFLMESIGVKNEAAEFTSWEFPSEKAVDLYPDIIFYDKSVGVEYLKSNQIYSTTEAVKKDRCYEVDAIVFERQSGRMFTELEKMFAAAYPDINITAVGEINTMPESSETQNNEKVPLDELEPKD